MSGWEFNATERRNFAEMMRRAPTEMLANVDTDTCAKIQRQTNAPKRLVHAKRAA